MKVIKNVSKSIYQVARYSGYLKIEGQEYIYNPKTDELILKSYLKEYIKQATEL